MARSQYRLALYDAHGLLIRGTAYTHVSDETPTPGLRIDLPQGTWYVREVVAKWDEDDSCRLVSASPPVVGALICHPESPTAAN